MITQNVTTRVAAKSNPGTVILPIGLPGSGKSSFTRSIKETVGYEVAVHSTDQFFIDKDGNYKFDKGLLGLYHQKNISAFEKSLYAKIPIIIIDNTNLRSRDRNKYVRLARRHGYAVQMVVIGGFSDAEVREYAKRNTHGINYTTISQMAKTASIPEEAL